MFCFRNQTLENGLQVIAECNDRAYSSAIAVFVQAGARDETDQNSGVSHFLEHMAFKGTPTRTAEDVNRQLDEIGTHSNASTGEEQTIYYAAMLPEYKDRALEILTDMMRPSLREEDFETEKQVILEEIRLYDDQPPFGAYERCMADHFGTHPLGRNVLGTEATVSDLTPQAMRQYFEQRYSPSNIVIAAAGRVDFDAFVQQVQKRCGHWEPLDAPRVTKPAAKRNAGFRLIHKPSAAQQYIVQITGAPAAEDDDRYASRIASTILGDDCGSRLFWEFVDTGRAEFATSGTYEYLGAGLMLTWMSCDPSNAADNFARLLDVQQNLEDKGITDAELEQAKNKIISHVVLQAERPANRLFAIGNGWSQRREYRPVQEVVKAYQAVTRDDVHAVLKKYPASKNTTVTSGPIQEWAQP